ncbi:alpha/beta fold hydrolase [Spongiibacter taiwanensis]|uniref:YqiA/YcfP family alpha/beta fold hydrolase n=1 Tax=Spongiibacter taiwanensis TaxID=1748242 RepID=UPI0020356B58|nr:YqiA/YcfP family alpha/beta fold hydrolase [Spongiibacter taiwanensis]USA41947.1 alpha/beta fold hydrolase [Spongiibacter taiwanensis]
MSAALVYLHGFISSPQSHKAVQMGEYLKSHHPDIHYAVPALGDTPDQAYERGSKAVMDCLARHDKVGLIGSSMGGFLSTVLAERFGLRAVLINPVVRPQHLVEKFIGEHHNPYTGSRFSLDSHHVDILTSLYLPALAAPQNYWALLQEGDETLDYRWAEDYYQHSKLTVEPGGDHAFQGFERYFHRVVEFLGLLG